MITAEQVILLMLIPVCCRLPTAEARDAHSSLSDQAQTFDDTAMQLPGKHSEAKQQSRQAVRRPLADITYSSATSGNILAGGHAVKGSKGCAPASVPDMVTFWEQRASMQVQ